MHANHQIGMVIPEGTFDSSALDTNNYTAQERALVPWSTRRAPNLNRSLAELSSVD